MLAPGGRVLIRDKGLVRRVDNSNDGGLLLSCAGVTEKGKKQSLSLLATRYRQIMKFAL